MYGFLLFTTRINSESLVMSALQTPTSSSIGTAARLYSAMVRNIPPTQRGDKKTAQHEVPPNSNTGERHKKQSNYKNSDDVGKVSIVDYLTFVLPSTNYYKQLPHSVKGSDTARTLNPELDLEKFAIKVEREILNIINLGLNLTKRGGRNGYKHSWAIVDSSGNECGFMAYGDNANKQGIETICINIAGEGTKCIGSFGYELLYKFMVENGAHITRIDLAHDCFNGEVTLIQLQNWYKAGLFRASSRGKYPDAMMYDDLGSGKGSTFQVGSRESGKLFRGYEKGKKFGDKTSKWVRLEVQLMSKKRVIPLDILLESSTYLSGTYKCMQFLNVEQSYIETQKQSEIISYKHLEAYCKQSYGRFIDVMMHVYETEQEVIKAIRRSDGYPRRLNLISIPVKE